MTRWNFVIQNSEGDYWCNENGWTEFRDWAAIYDDIQSYSLPMGGRWVNMPEAEAFRIGMSKLRDDADGGDMWGWAMSWLFDMCGYLIIERSTMPPPELEYRPGALGPDLPDEWHTEILRDMTTRQIVHCTKVLHRYADLLRKHGMDY